MRGWTLQTLWAPPASYVETIFTAMREQQGPSVEELFEE